MVGGSGGELTRLNVVQPIPGGVSISTQTHSGIAEIWPLAS